MLPAPSNPPSVALVQSANARRRTAAFAVIALLLVSAEQARAQEATSASFAIRPIVGALVPVGNQRDALKGGVLAGGQGAYTLDPNVFVIGALVWSRSQEKQSAQQPKLDLYQYDIGVEGRLNNLTEGSPAVTRPYITLGAGGRSYRLRNVANSSAQTDPLVYSALGLELARAGGTYGLRLELRDNISAFKGLRGELDDRVARHDLQLSAGLTFGL